MAFTRDMLAHVCDYCGLETAFHIWCTSMSACKYKDCPSHKTAVNEAAGGIKHDSDKPDLSMVSLEMLEAVARVRMFGAKKYSRDNWKKGFKVTRSLAASLRHIFAFLSGQTNDPESGESHLAHAVCCLEHAIYDMKHHPANDDRGTNEAAPQ